ncbi:MAG: DNA polymerase Y family protein [Pseudomonadota bacterium]
MTRTGNAPPDDMAVALVTEGQHGPVIHATNRAARMAGVSAGARVVDVKAVCPDLRVEYADLAGDRVALERLALWARRWCPWSVVDGPDGLILETTGADHLLGGEAALLVDMEARLSLLGLTVQVAVAPTWGAAWALARFGPVRAICPAEHTAQMLAPLPISALRLDVDTCQLLRRLGLKTIGAIAGVPRISLTRRFGRAGLDGNPLMRLDQALGHLAEPVASVDARPQIMVRTQLPDPIQDPTAYLPELCTQLCAQLTHHGFGCRRLWLTVYHTDGEVSAVEAATAAPARDPQHLLRLFEGKLERINPGFGFDLITLAADVVEPLDVVQTRLGGGAEEDLHLPRLIDRLSAKFGQRAVKRPILYESHVPERAEGTRPALQDVAEMAQPTPRERPIRLLAVPEEVRVLYAVPDGPPAQFSWRRKPHRVTRYEGPERIAPEWWHDTPGTRLRDYFKVEDQNGQRLWLYREGLHEDGRGGEPRWFVHGMFA